MTSNRIRSEGTVHIAVKRVVSWLCWVRIVSIPVSCIVYRPTAAERHSEAAHEIVAVRSKIARHRRMVETNPVINYGHQDRGASLGHVPGSGQVNDSVMPRLPRIERFIW